MTIPPGALASTTSISIERSTKSAPATSLSPVFVFGPEGTTFAKPVDVSFPVPANTAAATIYWTKPGSATQFEALPATVRETMATAQVTHFSQGFAGALCSEGASCTVPAACHGGALSCSSGTPVCADLGAVADGTTCGSELVCSSGQCIAACAAGQSCSGADACKAYLTTCNAIRTLSICDNVSGNRPDGTSCGTSDVCSSGSCIHACVANQTCTPAGTPEACRTYSTTCNTTLTQTSCSASGNRAEGAICGNGQVCDASGSCIVACIAGQRCLPSGQADLCKVYQTVCNALLTQSSCQITADATDGTVCGLGLTCRQGLCSRTVSGTLLTVFRKDDATTTTRPGLSGDFAPRLTGIVVPDGSASGYSTRPVSVATDGTFSVPGIASGNYFLQLDTPDFVIDTAGKSIPVIRRELHQTSTSAPDLSLLLHARADRHQAIGPTSVSVSVTNLDPWVHGEHLWMVTSQAGVSRALDARVSPADGATSLSGTFDWSAPAGIVDSSGSWIPDATKGDTTWLSQRINVFTTGASPVLHEYAGRYAKLANLTISDGASIVAALQAAPQTGSVTLDWKWTQFASMAPAINPSATVGTDQFLSGLSVFASPVTTAYPDLSLLILERLNLVVVTAPVPLVDTNHGTFTHGQFLDSIWHEWVQIIVFYTGTFTDPRPAGQPVPFLAGYLSAVPSLGPFIAPTLGPPTAPMINGADAFTTHTGIGEQPTFSWSAPSTGTVTSYQLRLEDNAPVAANEIQSVDVVVYAGTSIKFPPGFLKQGHAYQGTLSAINAGDRLDSPALRFGLPFTSMRAMFGLMLP